MNEKKKKRKKEEENPKLEENPQTIWEELLGKFTEGLEKCLEILEKRNIDSIPGADQLLMRKFRQMITYFPRDDGKILKHAIDEAIQQSFFPRTASLSQAFKQILAARTHEQDFIINELINGFISAKSKQLAQEKEGAVIDKIVEAMKKSKNFQLTDRTLYAMFGDPNKPAKYLKEALGKITKFLGLEEKTYEIEDLNTGNKKNIAVYTFPDEILEILNEDYIERLDSGETLINDSFDKNLFISLLLARLSIERDELDNFKINGISAIFALVLLISFMPKVEIPETDPLAQNEKFDPEIMSVIPKSWMMKEVLNILIPIFIQMVALRLGGTKWYNEIYTTEGMKKLHLQSRFLLQDVNRWILGNMVRVEIPIFVEISNIFQEITLDYDSEI